MAEYHNGPFAARLGIRCAGVHPHGRAHRPSTRRHRRRVRSSRQTPGPRLSVLGSTHAMPRLLRWPSQASTAIAQEMSQKAYRTGPCSRDSPMCAKGVISERAPNRSGGEPRERSGRRSGSSSKLLHLHPFLEDLRLLVRLAARLDGRFDVALRNASLNVEGPSAGRSALQPTPPPPLRAPGHPRSRLGMLFAIGALVLIALAGYLKGLRETRFVKRELELVSRSLEQLTRLAVLEYGGINRLGRSLASALNPTGESDMQSPEAKAAYQALGPESDRILEEAELVLSQAGKTLGWRYVPGFRER